MTYTLPDCPPLSINEKGRGVHMPPERIKQLQDFSARWVLGGRPQYECAAHLEASRSQVSRWAQVGLRHLGPSALGRLFKTRAKTFPQMLWSRIKVAGPDECWDWTGFVKPNGYGSLNFKGHAVNAHRAVYDLLVEPVQDCLVVDHICENKRCVNPRHLQQVTQSINAFVAKGRRDQ